MNRQIPVLRKKLQALTLDGVPQILTDAFTVIQELMFEQTALKIKISGEEITAPAFYDLLKNGYEKQLAELLEEENTTNVKQLTIES